MRARLFLFLDRIRSSYWFIPSLMLLVSTGLAAFLVLLDQRVDTERLTGAWWIFSGGADGARSVLSAIAGSVIGVAGTVFSITIAVFSLTSSQFGSRLLRGFLRDQGNQCVLGTFVATYLYCLLVLRMVRSQEESYFVPHLAVTGGMVLAIASIAVLLYFIHHVSVSIQSSQVIDNVACELNDGIERLFRDHKNDTPALATPPDTDRGEAIAADRSGYVEAIDHDRLTQCARDHGGCFRLEFSPGQFVAKGRTLATFHTSAATGETEAVRKAVNKSFHRGNQRTTAQDIEYLFQQVTGIGVRALSAAVNDPYTALACLDRLDEAICRLTECDLPSGLHHDEDKTLRIIAPPVVYADLLDVALGEIFHYGKDDPLVSTRLQTILDHLADCARTEEQKDAIARFQSRFTLPSA